MADVAKPRTPVTTQSVTTDRADEKTTVQAQSDRPEFISQGTWVELEQNGWAIDPRNGRKIVGTTVENARYEDPAKRVQASDVAAEVGATRATNEHTK
jgi:hypothetical protein